MTHPELESLLTGDDDEPVLNALWQAIGSASNDAQRTFCTVWEAAEFLPSDGFELLLEQATPLEEYAEAYARVGMSQIPPLFDRVLALIPQELRRPENQGAMFEHVRGLFEPLKRLLYDYLDLSADLVPKVALYVRNHRSDFAQWCNDPPSAR